MYKLACVDLDPATDCHFVATADTISASKSMMKDHLMSAHSDKMVSMSKADITKMDKKMDDVLAAQM